MNVEIQWDLIMEFIWNIKEINEIMQTNKLLNKICKRIKYVILVALMPNNFLKIFPKIIYLACNDNNKVTDKEIKNLSLRYLDCGENNQITDDGIKIRSLKFLNCGCNKNLT